MMLITLCHELSALLIAYRESTDLPKGTLYRALCATYNYSQLHLGLAKNWQLNNKCLYIYSNC